MTFQVRRGLDSDRVKIIPAEGELIFAVDTQKLYVGDGTTYGGILVNYLKGSTVPPSPPYTPPVEPYTPPVEPYTPPVEPYTPPVEPYTPPVEPYTPPPPATTVPPEIYTYSIPNNVEIGRSFFVIFSGRANVPFEYSIRLSDGKLIEGTDSLSYSSGRNGSLGTSRVEVLGFNVDSNGPPMVSVKFKDPVRGNVVISSPTTTQAPTTTIILQYDVWKETAPGAGTWQISESTTQSLGIAGARNYKINNAVRNGSVQIQDLTSGYQFSVNLDSYGDSPAFSVYFNSLGTHNIKLTFSDGHITNYSINVV